MSPPQIRTSAVSRVVVPVTKLKHVIDGHTTFLVFPHTKTKKQFPKENTNERNTPVLKYSSPRSNIGKELIRTMHFFRLFALIGMVSTSCQAFTMKRLSTTSSLPSTSSSSPSSSSYGSLLVEHHQEEGGLLSARKINGQKASSTSLTAIVGTGLEDAWGAYNDALQANPLFVKSVTASIILGAADLAGQALESAMKEGDNEDTGIDIARTARFAFFGLVLQAPWNHFYYQLLDGAIPPTEEPWTSTTGIKVVIDQFVQAPIFTVLIFAFLGFLEGKSTEAIKQQLDDDYTDTMLANCKFLLFFKTFDTVLSYGSTISLVC